MKKHSLWGTYRMPLVMALFILFGLLAALLGTGTWHLFAWIALAIPLGVIWRSIS